MKTPLLPLFNAKVLVVGDIMLDRYWHGNCTRISPEAPVPVVNVSQRDDRLGGAANVALNIVSLGAKAILIGHTGSDDEGLVVKKLLDNASIEYHLLESSLYPTITKLRVLSQDQQLIRLDFEQKLNLDNQLIIEKMNKILDEVDVVIMSDYDKGFLAHPKELIALARAKGKRVLVDPKHPSLDFYQGAHIITPNMKEFENIVGYCSDTPAIEVKGKTLAQNAQLDALLITRGAQGMSLIEKDKVSHIASKALDVYDVTGAGDTVIATLACALGVGASYLEACSIANEAAAIVVAKVGTATVSFTELKQKYDGTSSKIYQTNQLSDLVHVIEQLKSKGQKVVFTNGCFDVLHKGHVSYLTQAKDLGHILVIGLNSDASISRLKGPKRPINPLDNRLTVLAALQCVDFVIPFEEDTPLNLIQSLMPDVLCKGGDYIADAIVGAKDVKHHGGSVIILPFVENCSSSAIIQAMELN